MSNKTFSTAAHKQNSDLIGRTPCALGQTPYIGPRFIPMNHSSLPSGFSLLPWPGISPAPEQLQRIDGQEALKPRVAPPQSLLSLTQEIDPIASDLQSSASDTNPLHPPDDETQDPQPLTHSGEAQTLLDQTPFLTMDNRFKLVRTSMQTASNIADGLSELRQRAVIQSFQQVSVNGEPCFTVAFH